jgi:serine/threonine protein kinase
MSTHVKGVAAARDMSMSGNKPDLALDEQLQVEALRYKLLLRKKIGSGAFSVVFEAHWLDNDALPGSASRTFAAKCLYKDQDLKRIEDELRFLRMLT